MEYNNPRLDLKNNQKQNSSAIERCNEEKSKRHQEEIKYMKQVDSKGKKQKMQELMNGLNEQPKIDQWVIDLFNQLKKEKNREEYFQKFVEDALKNIGATYDSEAIKDLVSKYYRGSIKESLDFPDSVEIFNGAIQNLKGDMGKYIQRNLQQEVSKTQREIFLEKCHNIGKVILSSAFGKNFNLIGMSGSTGVYSVPGENIVYKLDTSKLAKALEEGKPYCDSSKSDDKENVLFQKMEEYFPEGSVLIPKNHKMTIEIDNDLINTLELPNINLPKKFTFLYTSSPIASEINNGGVGFNLGFGEGDIYRLMGNEFLERFNGEGINQEELNEYFDKKFNEVINNIKKLSNDDRKIKELLMGLVKFSEDNGIMLDIYGTDNFTFYLDSDGNLKYHIIDPFMPGIVSKTQIENKKNSTSKITHKNIHARSYKHIMQKIKNYCK